MSTDLSDQVSRWTISLTGKVQGVGFRPFVYRLARQLSLAGTVSNDGLAVTIIIEAGETECQHFIELLHHQLPSQAKIESIDIKQSLAKGNSGFKIIESQTSRYHLSELPADLAICKHCVKDLFNPQSRRYLSPFINCVDCGPRYSCLTALPYDRKNTTWSDFPECELCLKEYADADNRRFHAQGICCNNCSPRYSLVDHGKIALANDPIETTAKLIKSGKIVAVKGMSGFHLVCDANNDSAVAELRRRKCRPHKPFAMMGLNTSSLSQWVKLDSNSIDLLESREAPIVLLPKVNPDAGKELAPGVGDIGTMLPYTPVYLLLFYYLNECPPDETWLSEPSNLALVVTSANKSGEAIHNNNDACIEDLKDIADYFLIHNRDITFSCDDSVVQSGSPPVMIRRARSYAPLSVETQKSSHSKENEENQKNTVMAYGAHLKNTFCINHLGKAILSPHIGALSSPNQLERLDSLALSFLSLLKVSPSSLGCDLHKDYAATIKAEKHSKRQQLELHRIQHHHAHFAAAMAEHKADPSTPALGLILDGTGLGSDGNMWGGELFSYQHHQFKRLAQIEPLALPGGEKSTNEVWRIGAALLQKNAPDRLEELYANKLNSDFIKQFICHGKHIHTSSAGRWFDAVASVIGLRQNCSFEAQAAMELEALAGRQALPKPVGLVKLEDNQLKLSGLIDHLLDSDSQIEAAALFHSELLDGLRRWLLHYWSTPTGTHYRTHEDTQKDTQKSYNNIYASGGVFQNRILREGLYKALKPHGIVIKYQKLTPINDGGISLGQAWICQNLAQKYFNN